MSGRVAAGIADFLRFFGDRGSVLDGTWPRRVVHRAQAVSGNAGQHGLDILGDDLVAAFDKCPGARRVNEAQGCTWRQAGNIFR